MAARVPIVALVTAPADRAQEIAGTLVGESLAACVSVVPAVRSTYRWHGDVVHDQEELLVVKTTTDLIDALRSRLADIHPHEVFELVVLEVQGGNQAYLDWVAGAVREA